MKYEVKRISREMEVEPQHIEKVVQISDVLKRISSVTFLHKRLSLYGGTALNFIYFPDDTLFSCLSGYFRVSASS